MKTKIEEFREFISSKDVRKLLVKAGLKYSLVYSWGNTDRLPSELNAKKISSILGKPLSEIPYYRTEHVV